MAPSCCSRARILRIRMSRGRSTVAWIERTQIREPPSRRFQPRQLRLEIETQLRALILRQAAGHLREDGAIERSAFRVPRHRLRRPRLSQNLVQLLADLVGIGMVDRRLEIV